MNRQSSGNYSLALRKRVGERAIAIKMCILTQLTEVVCQISLLNVRKLPNLCTLVPSFSKGGAGVVCL